VPAYVTGTTAINIDTSNKLSAALPVYLVLVVGLALILLTFVFIFQEGHLGSLFGVQEKAPVISFLPITMVAILFGLAMDYQVFLVSRMRESYVTTHNPAGAVMSGFGAAARVVTAAAIIMIIVFGSFIFGGQPAIKSIGLALAFGVLADAFLVRMTLVPALVKLLGHAAWNLPGPVDRLMPNLDIEGERLTKEP